MKHDARPKPDNEDLDGQKGAARDNQNHRQFPARQPTDPHRNRIPIALSHIAAGHTYRRGAGWNGTFYFLLTMSHESPHPSPDADGPRDLPTGPPDRLMP